MKVSNTCSPYNIILANSGTGLPQMEGGIEETTKDGSVGTGQQSVL
jgi:hypothetical protein